MLLRLPPLVWGLGAIACGVVAAVVAWQKGRHVGFWFLAGLLLPVVGVAIVSILPATPRAAALEGADRPSLPADGEPRRYEPRPDTVYCHHCGAPNPAASTFCANCGEMLRV